MSKFSIATKLADEAGTTLTQALRFVDEVGETAARNALRTAENGLSWKIPATLSIGTGGLLAWRQQDVWVAQADAADTMSLEDMMRMVTDPDSELSDEERRALLEALKQEAGNGGGDSGGSDAGSGLPFSDLFSDMSIQQTVIALVVLLVVVQYVLNRASTAGLRTPATGVQ